jgi:hypothetical protein
MSRPGRGRAPRRFAADHAERQLFGDRLAHQVRPGVQQRVHGRRVRGGRRVAGQPVGIASPGDRARDVEDVLDRERHAGKRPPRRARDRDVAMGHEGPERILHDRILPDRTPVLDRPVRQQVGARRQVEQATSVVACRRVHVQPHTTAILNGLIAAATSARPRWHGPDYAGRQIEGVADRPDG